MRQNTFIALIFQFTSISPAVPEVWQMECLAAKKRAEILKKKEWPKMFYRITQNFDQFITMTRGIYSPIFVVIRWLVLTLSWEQGKFFTTLMAGWSWPKVTTLLNLASKLITVEDSCFSSCFLDCCLWERFVCINEIKIWFWPNKCQQKSTLHHFISKNNHVYTKYTIVIF